LHSRLSSNRKRNSPECASAIALQKCNPVSVVGGSLSN
jgi:hypothetical protein